MNSPSTGSSIVIGTRRTQLGPLIKSGGAGSVYLLPDDPNSAAKIYHARVDPPSYTDRIEAMLQLRPQLPDQIEGDKRYVQIAWPDATVRDDRGRFAGFTMPVLDVEATSELEQVLQERQARAAGFPVGLGRKVTLAANLASVLAALHKQHHYVVDLKPVNLRFDRASLYIALLDCDGFSIQGRGRRFHAPQYTPDYLAPEYQTRSLDETGEENPGPLRPGGGDLSTAEFRHPSVQRPARARRRADGRARPHPRALLRLRAQRQFVHVAEPGQRTRDDAGTVARSFRPRVRRRAGGAAEFGRMGRCVAPVCAAFARADRGVRQKSRTSALRWTGLRVVRAR
ncbi:hypothetical protein LC55x_5405 [Lysobacter capsici]|uniref:hypothetical protein n=1 Tax=Lysobacter capsici TaxID=435897 RepID=UPI0007225B4C|nr:hypothetical protein [Lysobacter capsici]ALN88651.1 hypothetical protein LC55x_5405 [Lysobacter capsici]